MTAIGIMQGRLSAAGDRPQSFPFDSWRDEFAQARACGFDRIEWLVTAHRLDENPLFAGWEEIPELIATTGVGVTSVCADCFIERPLVHVARAAEQAGLALLDRLIVHSSRIGVAVIVIPVLDANALRTRAEGRALINALAPVLARAEDLGIRLALESDLPAAEIRDVIEASPSTALGVCHDIGNAAAAGLDGPAEVRHLAARLSAVHVKDRRHGGASVPLGQGDADVLATWAALRAINYAGPLILETPRGADPLASAGENLAFVQRCLATGVGMPS